MGSNQLCSTHVCSLPHTMCRLGRKKKRDKIFGGAKLEVIKVGAAAALGRSGLLSACHAHAMLSACHAAPRMASLSCMNRCRCAILTLLAPLPAALQAKDATVTFKDIAGIDQVGLCLLPCMPCCSGRQEEAAAAAHRCCCFAGACRWHAAAWSSSLTCAVLVSRPCLCLPFPTALHLSIVA